MAIFTENKKMEIGLNRKLGERYPVIRTLLNGADIQQVGAITVTTNVRTGHCKEKVEKVIYKAVPKYKTDEINMFLVYRDLMLEVGSMATDDGVDMLFTTVPEGMEVIKMRKVVE